MVQSQRIDVELLRWNDWNISHIARHEVTVREVGEVCESGPLIDGTYKDRLRLLGRTRSGRVLAVILAPEEDGVYYTITARPASRKERAFYQERSAGQ